MGSDQIELSVINTNKVMSSSRRKYEFKRNIFNFVPSESIFLSLKKPRAFELEKIASEIQK